jgi:hypothetical protein
MALTGYSQSTGTIYYDRKTLLNNLKSAKVKTKHVVCRQTRTPEQYEISGDMVMFIHKYLVKAGHLREIAKIAPDTIPCSITDDALIIAWDNTKFTLKWQPITPANSITGFIDSMDLLKETRQ